MDSAQRCLELASDALERISDYYGELLSQCSTGDAVAELDARITALLLDAAPVGVSTSMATPLPESVLRAAARTSVEELVRGFSAQVSMQAAQLSLNAAKLRCVW